MTKGTTQVTVRLPADLLAFIDEQAKRLSAERGHGFAGRADVIREMLMLAKLTLSVNAPLVPKRGTR